MQILVHTDHNIESGATLTRLVETALEAAVGRFGDRITRIEVHLAAEAGGAKAHASEKRCVIEARLAGMGPVTATHLDPALELAIEGAAEKLETILDSTLERLGDPKGRTPYGGDPNP